ncbi:Pyrimidine reductase, riboflavin biosynthesis [Rhizobium sp. NFR07]|uniref:RibD family protein n=1 Tax=Rhizobium sp. NFR07 TaxID=1566262 RepID=UPI0008EED691|nr:RibD family protein [Rhizobium sp. NFR07]SFB10985.1 Pyrimidine reductase, riboflavin biosynthesis [Rhizobium sp. NFR07]
MKPYVICHMITSLDGGLHASSWTTSPDGDREDWSAYYEKIHRDFAADGWLVGRVTMAEMSKAEAHPPSDPSEVNRPVHIADDAAASHAIALDPSGRLHFSGADLDGDHVVVLLGRDVGDDHLAELATDGVSYIVSDGDEVDLAAMIRALGREFGIKRLLLEGGAGINGSLFAAGLVDELSLVVAPALDARKGGDRIVEFGEEGLAGKCTLSLMSCTEVGSGLLHLRYRVSKA